MKKVKNNKAIYLFLIIYFLINLTFLTSFPFIHSDEAWLSGLSRNILEKKDLSVTEPFFDLYPRHPHAIKIIFHLLQIIFLKIFSYHVFTFRLISLLAGTVTLFFFYKLSLLICSNKKFALPGTVALGINIQFIYASHFARQEIILVLLLIAALYYYFYSHNIFSPVNSNKPTEEEQKKKIQKLYPDIITGIILGAAIGIHPNSFIIALPLIFIYIYHLSFTNKIDIKNFFAFIITLSAFALGFILISFSFDPNFIHHYTGYGRKLGVLSPFTLKLDRLYYFFRKVFYRVSGTYYIPALKLQFIAFSILTIYSLIKLLFTRNRINILLLLSLLAINTGYVFIGRYNQTSIIFLFPFFYLLAINIFNNSKTGKYIFASVFIIIIAVNTAFNLYSDMDFTYNNYLEEISSAVSKDSTVLANLNCEYYFKNGKLFDYRNLAHLEENGLDFKEYIEKNNIEYIIYPQEIDFIYNTRPVWNILYGNIYPYYSDMQNFLQNNCYLIHQFAAPIYAMRIVRYTGEKNWQVKIYKVKEE